MVLLGVRPGGGSPGWHVLGRETFLAPVEWVDGWPVVGEVTTRAPVPPWPLHPAPAEAVRDDFDAVDLHPRWVSPRHRPEEDVTLKERPGWLTLRARGDGLDRRDVAFLGRRQQHLSCDARTLVDPAGGAGGLAVRLDEEHHYAIEAGGGRVAVTARIGPLRTEVAAAPLPPGPAVLALRVRPQEPGDARTGPDTVTFGTEDADGAFTALAELDGRYLSTEVAGGFTGRVLGVYAASGTVHFDWFDYAPGRDAPGTDGAAAS
jgi:beta-xylosidase